MNMFFNFESPNGDFICLFAEYNDGNVGTIDKSTVATFFGRDDFDDFPTKLTNKIWHANKIKKFMTNYTGSDKDLCKKVCTALIEQHYS